MKKLLLIIFLSFSAYSYVAAAPSPAGDAIVAGVAEEESIAVVSSTSENIRIAYSFKTPKTLKVYNLLGKCVSSVRLSTGSNTIDLPVALERGTYIYSLEEGGKSFTAKKFIVR